jgi:hypothetical protein
MPAPDGSTVACDLVRTGAGLEVRCDALPKRAQLVRNMAEGLELAKAWRSALREPKANVNAR